MTANPFATLGPQAAGLPSRTAPGTSPSDAALQATIAERFAGAYEAQLGYLQHMAAVEQRQLRSQNDTLRTAAYLAQRSAAEHRAQTEALKQQLGQGHLHNAQLREGLKRVRGEIASEVAALELCSQAVRQEEKVCADLEARVQDECADLAAKCSAAQEQYRRDEECASTLRSELAEARAARSGEEKAAEAEAGRERVAEAEEEQALRRLKSHEELAISALQEAVIKLETDFAQERADYAERARRAASKIQDMERRLDLNRRPLLEQLSPPGRLRPGPRPRS